MASKKLSRREMLKLMGGATAGTVFLVACGSQTSAPASSETTGEETSPTSTPKAEAPPAEDVTLAMWVWGATEIHDQRNAAIRSVYPELPNVEVTAIGSGSGEVAEQIRLALAAGQGLPDTAQLNYTMVPEFAVSDVLLDVGGSWEPYKADMYDGPKELGKYEGKFIAYPFDIKSKLFYYRKDLFEEAGISLDDMNSVENFIAAGKTFNAKNPDSYILNLGPEPAQYWMGELLSADETARMADKDGNYMVAEHPAFNNMFSFLKNVYDEDVSLKIDDWSSDWQQAFADEAICGWLCAAWVKFFLPKFAPEQTGLWDVALWPELAPMANQSFGSEAGGAVYIIPGDSENHAVTQDFLAKTFLDKDGALASYQAIGVAPNMKSATAEFLELAANPVRPDGMSDEDWAAQPANFFGPTYFEKEIASFETLKVFPYDPSAGSEIEILRNWLIRYMADEVELDGALAGAQKDMESQIGNPYDV